MPWYVYILIVLLFQGGWHWLARRSMLQVYAEKMEDDWNFTSTVAPGCFSLLVAVLLIVFLLPTSKSGGIGLIVLSVIWTFICGSIESIPRFNRQDREKQIEIEKRNKLRAASELRCQACGKRKLPDEIDNSFGESICQSCRLHARIKEHQSKRRYCFQCGELTFKPYSRSSADLDRKVGEDLAFCNTGCLDKFSEYSLCVECGRYVGCNPRRCTHCEHAVCSEPCWEKHGCR